MAVRGGGGRAGGVVGWRCGWRGCGGKVCRMSEKLPTLGHQRPSHQVPISIFLARHKECQISMMRIFI